MGPSAMSRFSRYTPHPKFFLNLEINQASFPEAAYWDTPSPAPPLGSPSLLPRLVSSAAASRIQAAPDSSGLCPQL